MAKANETLLDIIIECVYEVASVLSDFMTLRTIAHQAPLSLDSPGKNTGVGCHFLLQGICPTSLISYGLSGGFFTTSTT